MLIQIAILAWIFLGEGIAPQVINGMAVGAIDTVLVQLSGKMERKTGSSTTFIIIGGNIEDHLTSLDEVEAVGIHKVKYAIPYENNLTIFIGRGFIKSLEEIRQSNKIFI